MPYRTRIYPTDDCREIYMVRDVLGEDEKLVRCEYAQFGVDGDIVWLPCAEGVDFADIDPFAFVSGGSPASILNNILVRQANAR